jgi:hypothetical protein
MPCRNKHPIEALSLVEENVRIAKIGRLILQQNFGACDRNWTFWLLKPCALRVRRLCMKDDLYSTTRKVVSGIEDVHIPIWTGHYRASPATAMIIRILAIGGNESSLRVSLPIHQVR